VGHDREVPAVRAAQGRHPLGRAVGVAGVGSGDGVVVVHVAQRGQAVVQGGGEGVRAGEMGPPFTVRHPDAWKITKCEHRVEISKNSAEMHTILLSRALIHNR